MRLQNRLPAALTAFCLAASLVVQAADSPPAGIQMRARVLPSLRLEAGSPEATGSPSGVSAFSIASDTIRVEVTVEGGNGEPVRVRVPLTLHANVRTFLLRAQVAEVAEGEISLEGAAGVITSQPIALRNGPVFAQVSSTKFPTAPYSASLLLTLPPVPEGETRTVTVLVSMEATAR